jgi:hypothetical protein
MSAGRATRSRCSENRSHIILKLESARTPHGFLARTKSEPRQWGRPLMSLGSRPVCPPWARQTDVET